MKLKLTAIILCLLITLPSNVLAVTLTPTPSKAEPTAKPTSETVTTNLSNQINNLKEKIASRVAELKLVEKRGVLGTVKEATSTQITMTDIHNKNRIIDVDEITKFSSPSAKDSFGISDLKPGSKISVIGLYNKDSQRILARFITVVTNPTVVTGTISKKDEENFTLTITTENQKEYIIDIEKITKTLSYVDGDIEKSGFAQTEVGKRVMVVGFTQINQPERLIGTRVIVFPDLPTNPKIVIAPESDTEDEIVPSSGSGKKITPIR